MGLEIAERKSPVNYRKIVHKMKMKMKKKEMAKMKMKLKLVLIQQKW
jgi:hypothetical protein